MPPAARRAGRLQLGLVEQYIFDQLYVLGFDATTARRAECALASGGCRIVDAGEEGQAHLQATTLATGQGLQHLGHAVVHLLHLRQAHHQGPAQAFGQQVGQHAGAFAGLRLAAGQHQLGATFLEEIPEGVQGVKIPARSDDGRADADVFQPGAGEHAARPPAGVEIASAARDRGQDRALQQLEFAQVRVEGPGRCVGLLRHHDPAGASHADHLVEQLPVPTGRAEKEAGVGEVQALGGQAGRVRAAAQQLDVRPALSVDVSARDREILALGREAGWFSRAAEVHVHFDEFPPVPSTDAPRKARASGDDRARKKKRKDAKKARRRSR